jgi:ABC-type multidrug transport system ATPase subunit
MKAITINQISKNYNDITALTDISLEVDYGTIFGLIGPDGAGKTTLIRILTTLLLPDKGTAFVNKFDIIKDFQKVRNTIGYMPGKFSLYEDLTVEENVKFFATIFGSDFKENYYLIEKIYSHLEPFKNRLAGQLSGGMKQKLALSCSLIHKPEVLFLDEPTTGVDPVSRKEFWEMLFDLKKSGIAILVSTPYMDEATLCDNVALIQQGHIMQINKPENINSSFPFTIYAIETENIYGALTALRQDEDTYTAYAFGNKIHYLNNKNTTTFEKIANILKAQQITYSSLEIVDPTIEDSFIHLMRKK